LLFAAVAGATWVRVLVLFYMWLRASVSWQWSSTSFTWCRWPPCRHPGSSAGKRRAEKQAGGGHISREAQEGRAGATVSWQLQASKQSGWNRACECVRSSTKGATQSGLARTGTDAAYKRRRVWSTVLSPKNWLPAAEQLQARLAGLAGAHGWRHACPAQPAPSQTYGPKESSPSIRQTLPLLSCAGTREVAQPSNRHSSMPSTHSGSPRTSSARVSTSKN